LRRRQIFFLGSKSKRKGISTKAVAVAVEKVPKQICSGRINHHRVLLPLLHILRVNDEFAVTVLPLGGVGQWRIKMEGILHGPGGHPAAE
jgi:hypothetical protein